MKSVDWKACVCFTLMFFAGAAPALAQRVTPADAKAIRAVIEAQLNAFAADDADKAFSYAAPPIRTQFGSAANFMRMVKTGYPVVYRPVSVTFLKPESIDGEIMQAVQMTDDEGQGWVAHYRMLRQKAKPWLINGCQLERSDARIT